MKSIVEALFTTVLGLLAVAMNLLIWFYAVPVLLEHGTSSAFDLMVALLMLGALSLFCAWHINVLKNEI